MQSKQKSEVIVEHEESAADGLRYWVNSTVMTLGANYTINLLLQAMKQMIEQVAKPDQIERVEEVLTQQLNESYDYVRGKSPTEPSELSRLEDAIEEEVTKGEDNISYMTSVNNKKILH